MTDTIYIILICLSAITLAVTLFNTGKIVALNKHNISQDNSIEELESDVKAISTGQERMYSDFKEFVRVAISEAIKEQSSANTEERKILHSDIIEVRKMLFDALKQGE